MGQYKVPQDVEAEDKIIGFLTLKQFIYAVIGIAYGLLTFRIFADAIFLWLIIGVPPTFVFLMLGLYQRQGQPFETYFLALLNYWFKPRKRIWIKENILEVFQLEQPKAKAAELHRDPREVRGQLDKLAQIVDTRGWSAKNPELQEPGDVQPVVDLGDRLQTNEVTNARSEASEVNMADDILDMKNNPTARNLDVLIEDAEKTVRSQAMEIVKSKGTSVPSQPVGATSITEMTTNPTADILRRAMENTDLKVSQIAAQANRPSTDEGTLAAGQSVNLRTEQIPSGGTGTSTS